MLVMVVPVGHNLRRQAGRYLYMQCPVGTGEHRKHQQIKSHQQAAYRFHGAKVTSADVQPVVKKENVIDLTQPCLHAVRQLVDIVSPGQLRNPFRRDSSKPIQ